MILFKEKENNLAFYGFELFLDRNGLAGRIKVCTDRCRIQTKVIQILRI